MARKADIKQSQSTECYAEFVRFFPFQTPRIDPGMTGMLLEGQLTPNIKQFPKMGIAEKMIIEALSVHSGIEVKKIKEVLKKQGDIGAAAELILSKKVRQL